MLNSSSDEPIHQLPSNLVGSSHQSDQFSEPESEPEILPRAGSSEESQLMLFDLLSSIQTIIMSEQPNVNPSLQPNIDSVPRAGSSEEPQLSQPQSAEKDPNALAARITVDSKSVFHVAALCDQWEFILKLLELVSSPESIAVKDKIGRTVLHYVALGGSLKTAKALVQKNAGLPQIGDSYGDPPLLHSSWSENKELVWYLSSMTSPDLSPDATPFILRTLILSGYHGRN
ncbi:hypothetical protein QYF36_000425 [Acer negundo]|nr:hypothetical protein QYF36_000425 [Acer negundo]